MSADIAPVDAPLLHVTSGELLDATPENAARCKQAVREMRDRLSDVSAACDAVLVDEARRLGTKTLHLDDVTVTVTGGETVEYDVHALGEGLAAAGCPEERIAQAAVQTVTFKVNRAVLRQLAAANPEYRDAIRAAERVEEKPWRTSVKGNA